MARKVLARTGLCCRFQCVTLGLAFPADIQEKIFMPFQQADMSTTRQYGGTGLGLAISREIVKLMDGKIRLESEEGQGSNFILTVPFAVVAKHEEREAANLERGGCALIVDDNTTSRRLLQEMLSAWGMVTVGVADADEALEQLQSLSADGQAPSLLIADAELPGLDGYHFIERLRQTPRYEQLPVIILSTGGSAVAEEHPELGIAAEIVKPVKQSELMDAVQHALGVLEWHDEPDARTAMTHTPRPLKVLVAEDGPGQSEVDHRYSQSLGARGDLCGGWRARGRILGSGPV